MHTYRSALTFPDGHPANSKGVVNKYLFIIECAVDFRDVKPGERQPIMLMHGATPAAPTVMTQSEGFIIGKTDEVDLESNVLNLTFSREELAENPIPWEANFQGHVCSAPIHHDIEDQ